MIHNVFVYESHFNLFLKVDSVSILISVSQIFEVVLNSPSSNTCHEAACDAICSATYAMEDLQTNRLVKHKEISC